MLYFAGFSIGSQSHLSIGSQSRTKKIKENQESDIFYWFYFNSETEQCAHAKAYDLFLFTCHKTHTYTTSLFRPCM